MIPIGALHFVLGKYKEIPKNAGSFNAILAAECRRSI